MTSVDKARRPAAAAKARPQPARASKAGAKERPRRAKAPVSAPAGKPASASAKAAKAAKTVEVAKASSPISPPVAKPAAKTSAQIPGKLPAKSAAAKPASVAQSASKSAAEKPASAVQSAAKSPEKTPLEKPASVVGGALHQKGESQRSQAPLPLAGEGRVGAARAPRLVERLARPALPLIPSCERAGDRGPNVDAKRVGGGPAERSGSPADRLLPAEPTEKPRRGLGALGKRAFSGPAPVLPLLTGPRTPSRKPGPGPLTASELPAVAAGALPRDAVEFLRAELRAMLALVEDPPPR